MCHIPITHAQRHPIIFDQGISASGHRKEVVDGLNTIDKRYMYQLMSNVQLPGSKRLEKQILMHSCTHKKDIIMAKYFQKHLCNDDCKHGVIDQG